MERFKKIFITTLTGVILSIPSFARELSIDHMLLSNNEISGADIEHSLEVSGASASAAAMPLYYEGQSRDFNFSGDESNDSYDIELNTKTAINSEMLWPAYEDAGQATNITNSLQEEIAKAHALSDEVKKNKRFIDRLDNVFAVELPVGILPSNGDENYTIIIEEINLTKDGGYINAYLSFEVPQNGKKIAFGAKNITFTRKGGITGSVKLQLLSEHSMLLGENTLFTLKGDGKTFVEFDCDGYKSMGISAEVEFSDKMFVLENPDGTIKPGRVKTAFAINVYDWNNILAEISLDPFQIQGLKGVGFQITNAVFDFSDYANSPSMVFPENYEVSLMLPGNMNLWRGIYIREAAIRLPKEFKKNTSENTTPEGRIEFQAYNLLVDHLGFSGTFIAENIIKENDGDMSGWAFSIAKLGITFQASQLKEAGFSGSMNIPILKDNSGMDYSAIIKAGGEYIVSLSPKENVDISLFVAKGQFYSSSSITFEVIDSKFNATAYLDGRMDIEVPLSAGSSAKAKLGGVDFERMVVSTKKPYLQLGNMSFGGSNSHSFGKFPISIEDVGFFSKNNTAGIEFKIVLKLVGPEDGGFGADAGLKLTAELRESKWRYKSIELTEAGIDISGSAYRLQGRVKFFKEDATYGNGFSGQVTAEFNPGIKVNAKVLFGNVNNLRFWFADAMVEISNGIPLAPGFGLYGFGGGAYFHMRRQGFNESAGSDLGATASGVIYVPDKNTHLGLKAMVFIGTKPGRKVFNGDASFEITFNSGGGIKRIVFEGNGYFVTPPVPNPVAMLKEKCKKMAEKVGYKCDKLDTGTEKGSISANILIDFDIANSTLHANLKVFVNVAGGVIKGVNPGNLAGEAVLHFSPNNWYIHIGSPNKPVGLEIMRMVKVQGYFMVGDNIPGSPPPPPEVSEILGGIDLDYMKDLNALGNGSGIAFGARLTVDTGDLIFLMFYARFKAGVGFDIMLKNYGSAQCEGESGPIGINGWYANGQAFAYFEGEIGISVKIFMKRIKAEILKVGAAAVLQAKLPNPTWMRGIVGGRFSILGGLIRGNCKFEVTIGQECKIVGGSVLEGIEVIAEITPGSGDKDVNVFTQSQVVFNMPVEKVFELVDMDNKKKSFKIKLEHFKLYNGSAQVVGEVKWNEEKDVAAFKSFDILPGEKQITAKAKVSFLEKINNTWMAVKEDGVKLTQEKVVKFQTGKAPEIIPHENIVYSYPVINQYNFYPKEYNKGYIKLDYGQPYLFQVSSEWKQKGWFIDSYGKRHLFNFAYDATNKQLNFNIPSGLLNSKIYAFEIVNVPANALGAIDRNVQKNNRIAFEGADSLEVSFQQQTAEGGITQLQVKQVFTAYTRTSQFNTFNGKINSFAISGTWTWPVRQGILELGLNVTGNEIFDKFEIQGTENIDPLVQFEADLNNNWYRNFIHPLVYQGYPQLGLTIDWPNRPEVFSIPPKEAIFIRQEPNDKILEDSEIDNGMANAIPNVSSFVYELPLYMDKDYYNLRIKAANKLIYESNAWSANIISTPFPSIKPGTYPVILKYVLPGIKKVTSTKMLNIIRN